MISTCTTEYRLMEFSYVFIENLPEGITLSELPDSLKSNLALDNVKLFQYNSSKEFIDFHSALAKTKKPMSLESTNVFKKNKIQIGNNTLQITFLTSIDNFKNSFIFFNIHSDAVKAIANQMPSPSLIKSIVEIQTHRTPIVILQAKAKEPVLQNLNNLKDIEWAPIISDPEPIKFPDSILENCINFNPIHDVSLVYKENVFGLCKDISKNFSKMIENASDNQVITLPEINNGNIEDIIDFLWGKSITISFEKIPFLFAIATYIQSPQLLQQIDDYIKANVSPLSLSALAISFKFAGLKTVNFDWVIPKISEIVKCPQCLSDFPKEFVDDFIEKLKDVDPNDIAVIIDALPLENEEKVQKLKTLDISQITSSKSILSKYHV